ncbi:MAG: exodeoxyribonuclease VII small subunit [Thermoanaerobaculia bacterium]
MKKNGVILAGVGGEASELGAKGAGPEPGFSEAMRELEALLGRIEDDSLDIDRLAAELERAAQLLELCRGKIRRAELEVTEIVQKLEPG